MERLVTALDFKQPQAARCPKQFKTWSGTEGGPILVAVNSYTWSQDRRTSLSGIVISMEITAVRTAVIEMQVSYISIIPERYPPTAMLLLNGAFLALLVIVQPL
jgi:hypothetical protein